MNIRTFLAAFALTAALVLPAAAQDGLSKVMVTPSKVMVTPSSAGISAVPNRIQQPVNDPNTCYNYYYGPGSGYYYGHGHDTGYYYNNNGRLLQPAPPVRAKDCHFRDFDSERNHFRNRR